MTEPQTRSSPQHRRPRMQPLPPSGPQNPDTLARGADLRALLHHRSPHLRPVRVLRRPAAAARTLSHRTRHLPRLRRHHHQPGLRQLRTRSRTPARRALRTLRAHRRSRTDPPTSCFHEDITVPDREIHESLRAPGSQYLACNHLRACVFRLIDRPGYIDSFLTVRLCWQTLHALSGTFETTMPSSLAHRGGRGSSASPRADRRLSIDNCIGTWCRLGSQPSHHVELYDYFLIGKQIARQSRTRTRRFVAAATTCGLSTSTTAKTFCLKPCGRPKLLLSPVQHDVTQEAIDHRAVMPFPARFSVVG
jgi:hypothetical protein